MFPATFISGSCDFTLHFNFRCCARATFDKNLTNFAHAYILVMAWMGYARARLKTLSSLLKQVFKSSSEMKPKKTYSSISHMQSSESLTAHFYLSVIIKIDLVLIGLKTFPCLFFLVKFKALFSIIQ